MKLSGEDLLRYSNKMNQVLYENVRIIDCLTKKQIS